MPNKIVVLDKPITAHTVIKQLEFREPRWADIMEIGDPYVWTPRGDDYQVPTPLYDNVRLYAERLIAEGDKEGDPSHLQFLGVSDTRKVQKAIADFFLAVDPAVIAGSTTSPKTSGSTSESPPTS